MAADETDVGADEEEGGKKGGSKLTLILLLVNTLGLAGLAFYVVSGGGGGGEAQATPMEVAEEALDETGDDIATPAMRAEAGPMHEMDTLVVNLNEPSGDRYLKAKIHLEVDAEETLGELTTRKSQIRYQVNMLLAGQRVADVQGPENMESLRKAMIRRINAALSKGRVVGVWMVEWIVQ